jgi:CRISPR system Cascade subunit CasC
MLIEIHVIQNHSPANLNRDDLGAPKTCFFGGVLRSRISSQCLKRSIRMSEEFKPLLGGVRTRRLAEEIAKRVTGKDVKARAEKILTDCGIKSKESKSKDADENDDKGSNSKMLVYTTQEAIEEMAQLLQNDEHLTDEKLAQEFARLISEKTFVPDMALSGRMLEPDKSSKIWADLDKTVEAALQVAHAISTHEARPEVDYYVAADDIPGKDAGAGFVDEAMFASACFYKYFSIHWETLVSNLNGNKELAAHTVGAFLRGVALVNPTGKQNSFAAHNPPDGMLVEIKNSPVSYANAFAKPVSRENRDIISQSVAQMAQYIWDIDTGYGKPKDRFWFSPNLRFPLNYIEDKNEIPVSEQNLKSLDELIANVVKAIGYDWEEVRKIVVNSGVR